MEMLELYPTLLGRTLRHITDSRSGEDLSGKTFL